MHAQIVADALGVPYETVDVAAPDTALVPDSGPTVASRTCMVVGRILQRCAEDLKSQLQDLAAEYFHSVVRCASSRGYGHPNCPWDDAPTAAMPTRPMLGM